MGPAGAKTGPSARLQATCTDLASFHPIPSLNCRQACTLLSVRYPSPHRDCRNLPSLQPRPRNCIFPPIASRSRPGPVPKVPSIGTSVYLTLRHYRLSNPYPHDAAWIRGCRPHACFVRSYCRCLASCNSLSPFADIPQSPPPRRPSPSDFGIRPRPYRPEDFNF